MEEGRWTRALERVAGEFSIGRILLALLVLLLGALAGRAVNLAIERMGRRRSRDVQRVRRAIPLVNFGIWLVVVLIIATIFIESLLAVSILLFVVFIAGAIAFQPLLRDLAAGLVILFERPFQIGDRVVIGQLRGEVREIGMRAFRLETPDGALITIPNAEVLRSPIVNATRGEVESLVAIALPLGLEDDLARARSRATEAAAASPYLCIDRPIEVQVEGMEKMGEHDRVAQLVVKAYVFDAEYAERLRSDVFARWARWAKTER